MDPNARLQVNLNVLKKHDASITEIIDRCSHVVVYGFREAVKWTKSNIEGTLFLFKRSKSPAYGFFIMNRLGVENIMCFLTENVELQITPEYIIYRADQSIQPDGNLVYGLWVFESEDRDRVAKKLENLKSISNQTPTPAPAKESLPSSSSSSNEKSSCDKNKIDVVGLLQKAFDAHGVRSSAASSDARRGTNGNTGTQRKSSPPQQPPNASFLKGVDLDGKFLLSLIQPEGELDESSLSPTSGSSNVVKTRRSQEKSSKGNSNSSEEARSVTQSVPRNSKNTSASTSARTVTNKNPQQPASSVPARPLQTSPSSKTASEQQEQGQSIQGSNPFQLPQEAVLDNQSTSPSHPPGVSQRMQHPMLDEQQPTQPSGAGLEVPRQASPNPAQPPMQQHAVQPPPHPMFPKSFQPSVAPPLSPHMMPLSPHMMPLSPHMMPLSPHMMPLSPHMMPFLPGATPALSSGGLLYPPHAAAAAGTAFAARFYGNPGGGPISKDEFVGALFNLMQNDPLFMNFAYQTYVNSPKP